MEDCEADIHDGHNARLDRGIPHAVVHNDHYGHDILGDRDNDRRVGRNDRRVVHNVDDRRDSIPVWEASVVDRAVCKA